VVKTASNFVEDILTSVMRLSWTTGMGFYLCIQPQYYIKVFIAVMTQKTCSWALTQLGGICSSNL